MRRILALLPCLLLLVVAAPALSRPWSPPPPYRLPNLSGTWFNSGDENQPCYIRMRPDGSALFTNENGSTAPGEVRVGRVIIPDWSAGEDVPGLEGRIRGDRIIWPDGNFWLREPR